MIIKDFASNDPQMLTVVVGETIKVATVHKRWVFAEKEFTKGWIPIICVELSALSLQ